MSARMTREEIRKLIAATADASGAYAAEARMRLVDEFDALTRTEAEKGADTQERCDCGKSMEACADTEDCSNQSMPGEETR